MKITLYHNPRCSKSRQALELLRANGCEPTVVEYLKTPPDEATLRALIQQLGVPARSLLRTKETEYTQAGLDQMEVNDDIIIAAITRYPILLERPIAVIDDYAAIGRPPENILQLLTKARTKA